MGRVLLLLVALTGCDAVFGVSHVGSSDVHGHWGRQYLSNNQNHAPIVDEVPFRADEIVSLDVRAEDGTALAATWDYTTGDITFPNPDGPYRVTVQFATGAIEELQLATPVFDHALPVYQRRDAVLGDSPTTLDGTITPEAGATLVQTTGVWTQTSIGTAGPYSIAWTYPLLDASKFDRMYVSRFSTVDNVSAVTSFGTRDVTMTSGSNTGADVTLVDLTAPWCAIVTSQANAEIARIAADHPDLSEHDYFGWFLDANPSNELPPSFLLTLASPVLIQDTTTFHYSTPFAGFGTRLNLAAQRQLTITSPVSITRYAGTSAFFAIQDSVACENYTLAAGVVALPRDIALGGSPLATDGQQVIVDNKPIDLTWSVGDGTVDAFRVTLSDVTNGKLLVRAYLTLDPHLAIDPAVFVTGHDYMFQINAVAGVPNAAKGDFRTIATTYASSYVNPPVFVVTRGI